MINIKLLEYDKELGNSLLKLNISGDVSYCHMNAMKRIIHSSIKQRAFSYNNFNIKKNTSTFHNSQLIKYISQIPIWISDDIIDKQINIKNTNEILPNDNNNEETDEDDNLDDTIQQINTSSLKQLTMYIKYHNKKSDIINITTNDCLFYFGKKKIESPYVEPILITKLTPNAEIEFSVITDINDENKHTIYSPVSITSYKSINNLSNDFIFVLESRGQLTEKKILLITIEYILNMLNIFSNLIINKNELNNILNGEFTIIDNKNEIYDLHALGSLIVYELQNHKSVNFASYKLLHLLSDTITFEFKIKNNNIINIINESIKKLTVLFTKISSEFNLHL